MLGQAVLEALGDKKGLVRYGVGDAPHGRGARHRGARSLRPPLLRLEVPLPKAKLGTWDVELAPIFFEAFARTAMCNLHLRLHEGENLHHIVEISFKAFAKALSQATRIDPRITVVPSTKGAL